jgi:hypothetical protein
MQTWLPEHEHTVEPPLSRTRNTGWASELCIRAICRARSHIMVSGLEKAHRLDTPRSGGGSGALRTRVGLWLFGSMGRPQE